MNYRRARNLPWARGKKELETGFLVELGYTFRHKFVIAQSKADQDSMYYYFNAALAAYREAKDTASEISMLIDIGNLHLSTRNFEEAERLMLHTISLAEKHNKQFFLPVTVYGNLGVVYFAKGDLIQSLRYKEQALDAGKKFGWLYSNPATPYRDMGDINLQLKKFPQAIKYYELSLESAKAANLMDTFVASANSGLADAYYGLGDLKKAFDYQRKFTQLRDSLLREINSAEMIRLQNRFRTVPGNRQD